MSSNGKISFTLKNKSTDNKDSKIESKNSVETAKDNKTLSFERSIKNDVVIDDTKNKTNNEDSVITSYDLFSDFSNKDNIVEALERIKNEYLDNKELKISEDARTIYNQLSGMYIKLEDLALNSNLNVVDDFYNAYDSVDKVVKNKVYDKAFDLVLESTVTNGTYINHYKMMKNMVVYKQKSNQADKKILKDLSDCLVNDVENDNFVFSKFIYFSVIPTLKTILIRRGILHKYQNIKTIIFDAFYAFKDKKISIDSFAEKIYKIKSEIVYFGTLNDLFDNDAEELIDSYRMISSSKNNNVGDFLDALEFIDDEEIDQAEGSERNVEYLDFIENKVSQIYDIGVVVRDDKSVVPYILDNHIKTFCCDEKIENEYSNYELISFLK